MEYIGVPLVTLVRTLGPPIVVLGIGALLILRRRPPRARLLWAALAAHLLAAALPFLWLLVQVSTGLTGETVVALIMTLVQPGVEFAAWLLVFAMIFGRRVSPMDAAPAEHAGFEPRPGRPDPGSSPGSGAAASADPVDQREQG
ncbi:hypothetical protein F4561_003223 [Lipingzhangella halophila]|uniref:Uncharacterized protein n=1 Tax=Lipingzhangella halophila TaxID=1783352 RepID=A0A7W7RI65_9ACTN|nr:hypothetical protein [Lipingzhangella halophila]MBB4932403.1 hypothetical protein [Lipingzhangella halophila]